jgi:hypothetical protein
MRFFALMISKQEITKTDVKKCLISYQFVNLKLFHPEQVNLDRTEIAYFFNLAHAWYVV